MTQITTTEWGRLYASLERGKYRWRQGEHISILGPTGSGKTYLGLRLLPLRPYTLVFGTKPRDRELSTYARENGYETIRQWPPSDWENRALLWPKYTKPGDEVKQRATFVNAVDHLFASGGWTVFIDEIFYWTNILRMERYLSALWTQGRSLGISLLGATQRPKAVPLLMYDQATHLFFFRFGDENDLKRIGGIGYLDRKEIQAKVARLDRHEFLYIHVPTGSLTISKVEEV